jgi:hypothetical protein
MRNNQAAASMPNSAANPLPIAFCADKIPLAASLQYRAQAIDSQGIIEVESAQLGRRNGFFR